MTSHYFVKWQQPIVNKSGIPWYCINNCNWHRYWYWYLHCNWYRYCNISFVIWQLIVNNSSTSSAAGTAILVVHLPIALFWLASTPLFSTQISHCKVLHHTFCTRSCNLSSWSFELPGIYCQRYVWAYTKQCTVQALQAVQAVHSAQMYMQAYRQHRQCTVPPIESVVGPPVNHLAPLHYISALPLLLSCQLLSLVQSLGLQHHPFPPILSQLTPFQQSSCRTAVQHPLNCVSVNSPICKYLEWPPLPLRLNLHTSEKVSLALFQRPHNSYSTTPTEAKLPVLTRIYSKLIFYPIAMLLEEEQRITESL